MYELSVTTCTCSMFSANDPCQVDWFRLCVYELRVNTGCMFSANDPCQVDWFRLCVYELRVNTGCMFSANDPCQVDCGSGGVCMN